MKLNNKKKASKRRNSNIDRQATLLASFGAETSASKANAMAARKPTFSPAHHGTVVILHARPLKMVTRWLAHSCLGLMHHPLCSQSNNIYPTISFQRIEIHGFYIQIYSLHLKTQNNSFVFLFVYIFLNNYISCY